MGSVHAYMCIQTTCTTVEENLISSVQLDAQNSRSKLYLYIIPYYSQQLQQRLSDICPGSVTVQHLLSHTFSTAQFKKKLTHYLSNWVLSGCCTTPSGLQVFYSPSYEVSMTQSYFGGWLLHTGHNLKPFSSTDRKEKSIKVMQFLCRIDFSYLNLND